MATHATNRAHTKRGAVDLGRSAARDEYAPAKPYAKLTPGSTVRVFRELQEMTQAELAKVSGVMQPTISAVESGRIALGLERARKLAAALKVHPALLLFPDLANKQGKGLDVALDRLARDIKG